MQVIALIDTDRFILVSSSTFKLINELIYQLLIIWYAPTEQSAQNRPSFMYSKIIFETKWFILGPVV